MTTVSLEKLWGIYQFKPNPEQEKAIRHIDGPLYLPAGPGSGKTRVLLWRAVNLIVCNGVSPKEIYLATFTEKAAGQLKEGLRSLLGAASNFTNDPYDLAEMYVGTVHSLCRRLILDRRFHLNRARGKSSVLLDDLGQYFHLYNKRTWEQLVERVGLGEDANSVINQVFESKSSSRHEAVTHCISFFNRLSEERIDPQSLLPQVTDAGLHTVVELYAHYLESLRPPGQPRRVDFALLQQEAHSVLDAYSGGGNVFKHVIIDEYQDTNTIQESLFFRLAAGHRNICVVGDDDQALYRFRGATVENFVQFPKRCQQRLGVAPREIPLATNYRSRVQVVKFFGDFLNQCNWRKEGGGFYRVASKKIVANSADKEVSVVASQPAEPLVVCKEIAGLVRRLIDEGRVEDPSQIAFLYPSLKYKGKMTDQVARMKQALEDEGLQVYAPRAGRFLEVDEAIDLFGLMVRIFGKPVRGDFPGQDYSHFHDWIDVCAATAEQLCAKDRELGHYISDCQAELERARVDYEAMLAVAQKKGWDIKDPYDHSQMKTALIAARDLSGKARHSLESSHFEKMMERRAATGNAPALSYVIKSATSIDWNLLDLFYRLCGFQPFRHMFDLAESGRDEGPICNLGLISQYLARFAEEYVSLITGDLLQDGKFQRILYMSFLFALFRRGESEYEDAEDPFPRGRIPFLTIHQSKGLEFPVVVLGNPRKDDRGPQLNERLLRDYHDSIERDSEPLDKQDRKAHV